jgi:hypothetical protein
MAIRARSLWPREHGAYVQLAVPLVTALVLTGGSVAGGAIAISAGLAFVASEPLRIVIGAHGLRVRAQHGDRARRRLALLGIPAVLVGAAGLAMAPRAAMGMAAMATVLLGFVVHAAWRRTEGTARVETIAAIGLAGVAAPAAVASGASVRTALAMWGGWSLAFVLTVAAVHQMLARHRRTPTSNAPRWIVAATASVALGALIAVAPRAGFALPLAIAALGVLAMPPRATRLRALGVALLVLSMVSGATAIAAG